MKQSGLNAKGHQQRIALAQEWIDGATNVAMITKDLEAQKLVNNFLSEVSIGQPDRQKDIVLIHKPRSATLTLVPILANEAEYTDITRLLMVGAEELPPAAYFKEAKPGIVYFSAANKLSPIIMGLILLHELKHASYYLELVSNKNSKIDEWREEVLAFEFELQLLAKLGGKRYSKYIDSCVSKFVNLYNDNDGAGGMLPGPELLKAVELNYFLGMSQSPREIEIRKSILWVNTVFRLFEAKYPREHMTDKELFMKEISAK